MKKVAKAKPSRSDKITAYLAGRVKDTSPDTLMEFVYIDDVKKATGLSAVNGNDLEGAAKLCDSPAFYVVARGPDEYSDEPYIIISPKPQKKNAGKGSKKPPDPCWIVKSPDRSSSRAIKEGLLVFSAPGYANGFMFSQGVGDFNIEHWEWPKLAKKAAATYKAAVIDYQGEGRPFDIIPFDSK